jgi:site-specific DNA-methyltransferase (adenine-specific)
MKPYYADNAVTIYHGDCREILPSLAGVGAIVSDPPYGIAYQGGQGGNLIHSARARKSEPVNGDAEPFDPSPFLTFAYVALFGAQHYPSRLPDGGTFHVWDKRGDYKPVHTADFDTVWINRKEPGRILRCVWRGICREVEHDQAILHPTQKPLRVMEWVLGMFPADALVLDPFMGSGTTLRAAKNLGRRAIGIEIEERYCEIAARRMGQEVFDLSVAA